jgi:Ca-activated chloride channel homolog
MLLDTDQAITLTTESGAKLGSGFVRQRDFHLLPYTRDPVISRQVTKVRRIFASLLGLVLCIAFATRQMQAQNSPSPPPSPPPQQGSQTPPPSGQQGQRGQKPPEYSISVESNLVNVDMVVTNQEGNILTGLKKENFRIIDDGQPQRIANFSPTDAPITVVLLMEYSARFRNYFAAKGLYWGSDFLSHLNEQDWVALVTYSIRSTVRVDFTQNKNEVLQAMNTLGFPDFHEANMFDALLDTIDRLQDVKGKRAILLITTGADTFSKHTLDQAYKRLRQSDVPIFSVGLAETETELADARGRISGGGYVGYLQAKNELDTFGKLTGGYAWFPRFDGEIPGIFQSVAAFLRNQYTIGFMPSNAAHDGKYHKLKIEVVEPDGNPLNITNKKGKREKIVVYAREGYTAPKDTVGD